MLVSISGKQGQGKSTFIDYVNEKYGIKSLPHKSARAKIKEISMECTGKEDGLTLDDINRDLNLKKAFQEKIIDFHYKNEIDYTKSDEIYLVERSYADIYSYTLLSLGLFNEYNEFLKDYKNKCINYQNNYLFSVILHGRDGDSVEDDGVRSTCSDISIMVEHGIKEFFDQTSHDGFLIDNSDLYYAGEEFMKILSLNLEVMWGFYD